jgi:hypothetical protein
MSDININPEEQKSIEETVTATVHSPEPEPTPETPPAEEGKIEVVAEVSYPKGEEGATSVVEEDVSVSGQSKPKAEERHAGEKLTILNANLDEFDTFLEEGKLEVFITYMQQFAPADITKNNIRKVGRLKKAFDQLFQNEIKQIKVNIPETDLTGREKERERLNALKAKFDASLQKFNDRKNEFEEQDKKNKQINQDKKKALLDELRAIVMSEDVTAIERVRKIQESWKAVGPVPMEDAEAIYQTYRHFLDQFYRLRDSYNELVEQDRKINLEEKEKIINELMSLLPADSSQLGAVYWQEAAEKVKSLHELWKTIGPVPRSKSDEIWKRFKDATDQFYALRRTFFEELDKKRADNAERKKELLAKLRELAVFESNNIDDWRKVTDEVRLIQKEWRDIGSAPASINKELINEYNQLTNSFFERRTTYFKELDSEKEELLKKKENLLRQAEVLKDNEDWATTAEMLKQIQKEWQTTGPDDYKEARKLRKRFRKACDAFFKRHKQHFQDLREQEEENLKKKIAVCEEIEALFANPEAENLAEEMRRLKELYESIGRVPIKAKDKIQAKFHKLYSQYLQKMVKDPLERDKLTMESKIQALQNQPNGVQRFQREERRYIKKIKALEDKIQQYENNIMFISQGKNGGMLRNEIESQITTAKELKERLEQRLEIMRKASGASNTGGNQ